MTGRAGSRAHKGSQWDSEHRGGEDGGAQPSQGLEEVTFYSKSQKMAFSLFLQEDTFCLACLCLIFLS